MAKHLLATRIVWKICETKDKATQTIPEEWTRGGWIDYNAGPSGWEKRGWGRMRTVNIRKLVTPSLVNWAIRTDGTQWPIRRKRPKGRMFTSNS